MVSARPMNNQWSSLPRRKRAANRPLARLPRRGPEEVAADPVAKAESKAKREAKAPPASLTDRRKGSRKERALAARAARAMRARLETAAEKTAAAGRAVEETVAEEIALEETAAAGRALEEIAAVRVAPRRARQDPRPLPRPIRPLPVRPLPTPRIDRTGDPPVIPLRPKAPAEQASPPQRAVRGARQRPPVAGKIRESPPPPR